MRVFYYATLLHWGYARYFATSGCSWNVIAFFFFFQAEDGIRDKLVTGVQTCALPISSPSNSMSTPISRRTFLRQFNCAAVGSSAILNTLLNLKLANNLAAQAAPGNKALVCLFLSGGCDSFNLLVPRETSRYAAYSTSRGAYGTDGGLAIDRNA